MKTQERENDGLAFVVQIGLNCQTKEGLITLPLSNCGVVKAVFVLAPGPSGRRRRRHGKLCTVGTHA